MTIFSLDLGNKQVKLISEKTLEQQRNASTKKKDEPKTLVERLGAKILPSHYLDYDDLGDQRTALNTKDQLHIKKYVSSKDPDFAYAWGTDLHLVHAEEKFISTIGFEDRYSRREFKVLADMSIGELAMDFEEAKTGILEVTVTTGVPTDDFTESAVKAITQTLLGDHNIKVEDFSLNVRVKEVIVNPQPVGTAYNEVLDIEGFIIEEKASLLEEQVVVVDIGGGTMLIDTLKNMNLSSPRTQKPSGAYELYDRIVNLVTDSGIKGLTSYEVERILRESDPKEGYFFKPNKNESFPITNFVNKAITKYTRDVLNIISTTLKATLRNDTMLLTGGTSNVVRQDEVKSQYQYAHFVKDAEIANALGFYKYAKATVAARSE
ncbi:Alp7A family actin-like protein [Paenibacillus sp. USHLN196]|uniref:Alp7A family actin-like protein n=1 Tax=Paenibacillus sp. USHLN196 TaxID=3081291 RepID=UPI00301993B2